MKYLTIALMALALASCATEQTQLRITCADGGGVGSWVGLGGKVNAMTFTEPGHIFTPEEIELFRTTCPRDNEIATMMRDLLATQRAPDRTSPL